MPADWTELLDADRRHVWHPYGPMPGAMAPLPVTSARGVRLRLADGEELIDGMASWWCAIHGYRHAVLDAAVTDQLGRMAHVMFGGLTYEGAIELATRLVTMTPEGLDHVFFADSGSVSVEVAIKLCLQARPGRRRLITVRGGYHGDTFGAMAICDPEGGMHALWRGALAEHVFADRPRGSSTTRTPPTCARWSSATRRSARRSSWSRCCRARAACGPTTPRSCGCCASCATSTACCWRSTRSRPASVARARCSRPSTPASRRTCCVWARRSPAAT